MKRTIVSLAFLILALRPGLYALTISVYHTGDVHGWYSSQPAAWDKKNSTRTVGGFPALSALIKKDTNPYILLDSGDTFQGTPEGNMTKGMASVVLMNQLGYSAALVGNHDYDYTEDNLRVLASSSSFPWLGANVYAKDTGTEPSYLKPYTIIRKAGKKIAVIGIAGRHTAITTFPSYVKHLDFRDEAGEAAKWTEEVKTKEDPDAILILAHVGFGAGVVSRTDISTRTFTDDETRFGTVAIARAARGANVVMGGHNHVGLLKGWHDPKSGALLTESYSWLTDVSRITLRFDDATGKFTGATDELIPLWTDTTGEDPAVIATIKQFSGVVDEEMSKPLGESEVDLGPDADGLNSPIGNWMADAMRRQAGTDMAFQNTSGIRAAIKKGTLKIRDIYQVMPFENTLIKLKMTGAQIRRLIGDNLPGGKAKMQVSGLTVRFRLPPGGKATDIVLERDGKVIADDEEFSVVTNSFLTSGGTGGRAFKEGKDLTDTLLPVRDYLMKDVKETSPLKLPAGPRYTKLD